MADNPGQVVPLPAKRRRRKSGLALAEGAPGEPGALLRFPQQRAFPYGKAPRFDPSNVAHINAWQALWEFGNRDLDGGWGRERKED